MQAVLAAAEKTLQDPAHTGEQLKKAAADLRSAVKNLKKPMPTAPVALPEKGVIEITSADQLNMLDAASTEGKYYRLAGDLVIDSPYWFSAAMAGVLDGNGHTVTIAGTSPLFMELTETGVIQNVNFAGESDQEIAPAVQTLRGAILNCRSTFSGSSSGFAVKMDGGLIANSLVLGNAARGAFVQKYVSGRLLNSVWPDYVKNGIPEDARQESEALGDKDLRSGKLRDRMNAGRGSSGTAWGQGSDGYPYFGPDQDYRPDGGLRNRSPAVFRARDTEEDTPAGEELTLSPDQVDLSSLAGTFRLLNVPEGSRILWACDDRGSGSMAINEEDGRFYIYSAGSATVTATEVRQDGTAEKAAEISVVSAAKEITEIRLFSGETEVTGKTLTVQGSEDGHLDVKVRYKGEETLTEVSSGLFTFTPDDPELIHTTGTSGLFRFTKPGTGIMQVSSRNGITASVTLVSEYVPVISIRPAFSGTVTVHGRNSMGKGQFNTFESDVIIEPANASYQSGYTVSTSDENVAFWSPGLPRGYIPMGGGNVTFTAGIMNRDPATGAQTEVTGKSSAEIVYKNPLVSVTGPKKAEVKAGEELPLDLTFAGALTGGWAVTEPELIWTFRGDGQVKITRPVPLEQIRDVSRPDHGDWVASTAYTVKGVKAGTVVATGTPVDTSENAAPVVITFTVTPGEEGGGFDTDRFVAEGRKTAVDYLNRNLHYAYGDEWKIFTLLRAGETLSEADLEAYYQSAAAEASTWNESKKPTDIARAALALSAMGRDITDVNGVNLAALLYNNTGLTAGTNELAWALLALDARNTPIPAGAKWTRDKMLTALAGFQNPDGGFPLNAGGASGQDTTAMALQAMAPYKSQKAAIEKGLAYLKAEQTENFDAGTSETVAQNILTLAVLGRDPVSEPGFVSEPDSLMSALSLYFEKDQGFRHVKNGKINEMAVTQALEALDGYTRFKNGLSGYWNLESFTPETAEHTFLEGANQTLRRGELPETLRYRVSGEQKNFVSISVSGTALTAKDFTAEKEKDSVTIRIARSFLERLEPGTHKVTVTFTDGSVSTRLYVEKAEEKPEPQPEIGVYFMLYGDSKHGEDGTVHTYRYTKENLQVWEGYQQVKVPAGASVLDVIEKACRGKHTISNPSGAYIAGIDGLKEFDNGPRSGWMYLLNGVYSENGVADQTVKDGDTLIVHYTDDYTLEKGAGENPNIRSTEKLIDVIGRVTENSGERIAAARRAYDALTDSEKRQIANASVLFKAEREYARITASAEDRKKAAEAERKIRDIGTVKDSSGPAVEAARKVYDALTEEQKKLVGNYDVLLAAEARLELLKGLPLRELYGKTGEELEQMAAESAPVVDPIGGEWLVIGLSRSGRPVNEEYYQNVLDFVRANINEKEQLHPAKSTENSRVILALTALGRNPADVDGHDLLAGLSDLKYVKKQGINGPVWALIALDSGNYPDPADPEAETPATRETLIAYILEQQCTDGGWTLSGSRGDMDNTAMALTALAPYQDRPEVKKATEKALEFLSRNQDYLGRFPVPGASAPVSESSSQVLVALTALGLDPDTDPRFIKNGFTAADGLHCFAADTGFAHMPGGERDQMATEQAYYALTAYYRFKEGKSPLFAMADSAEHIHEYTWFISREPSAESEGELTGTCSCGKTAAKVLPAGTEIRLEKESDSRYEGALSGEKLMGSIPLSTEEAEALAEGKNLTVTLSIREGTASEAQKQAAEEAAGEKELAAWLDISLWKTLGDGERVPVPETANPLRVAVRLPEELRDREGLAVVRIHDGKAELLPCREEKDGYLSFETDAFSLYALAADQTGGKTGGFRIWMVLVPLIVLILAAAAVFICWYLKKKKK